MWKLEFSLLCDFLGAKSQEAVEPNELAADAKDSFVPRLPPSLFPLHPLLHRPGISLAAYSASAQKFQLTNSARITPILFMG